MRDETHIGLVDAHAEGDRGHHDHAFFVQETCLMLAAHIVVQAGMIGQRGEPLFGEPRRDFIHALAR